MTTTNEITGTVLRSTPPVTVSLLGATIQLSEWVYIATFFYVVLQIVVIFPKVVAVFKRRKDGEASK